MNPSNRSSSDRFDDHLTERDARKRQDARRRAAEARSRTRSNQEGPYASGAGGERVRPPRATARQARNHYDAREEFARLDDEARERDARRVARQHGLAPRTIGEPPSDPYERARIEQMPARRLRERAEEMEHAGRRSDEYRRDRTREHAEELERRAQRQAERRIPGRLGESLADSPIASAVQALPFFGNDAPTGRPGERTRDRAQRHDFGEEPRRRTERTHAGRSNSRRGRLEPHETPHRVGAENTQARWRSSHGEGRPRPSRREQARSDWRESRREGFSARRDQVDLSPVGNRRRIAGSDGPAIPFGLILKAAVAVVVIALVVFAGWNIAQAQAVTITVNGAEQNIGGRQDVNALLASVETEPGDFVAIDGSVIAAGGGYPATVTVNGQLVTDYATGLSENDTVELSRGGDIQETSHVEERDRAIEAVESGTGAIHRVVQEGRQGRENVTVGDASGIAVVNEVLDEGEPRVYRKYAIDTGGEKVVALTFDDGPVPEYTIPILDALKEHGAKATFFTLGTNVEKEGGGDIVKRAVEEGHQVCTHTYDHAAGSGQGVNLSYMTAEEQRAEILSGQSINATATGQEASTVFRAPGGNFPLDVWRNVDDLVSAEIGWNIDSFDWKKPGTDAIANAICQAGPGDIVLLHDGGGDRQQTVDALKKALPKLKEQGYRFVTIDELLEYPAKEEEA